MFFFFTCGSQDFSSQLKGYEHMRIVCPRCHNVSVSPIKKRNFFTFCFIPIFPIAWGEELRCGICGYHQKTSENELQQIQNQQGRV
ncbi:hypothetical protein BJ508DRAFT_12461 [Ascobolus immersus RN42]|uniref:Uncharacterized protein n=1 Tax=Ascobolus immersus RN42 TaxID=1160509 RepID=A0A3N4ILP5_ASCIM|nr:hypothetical protein BJ508DRAFT_12461 [Ascobolus immersus RN42]